MHQLTLEWFLERQEVTGTPLRSEVPEATILGSSFYHDNTSASKHQFGILPPAYQYQGPNPPTSGTTSALSPHGPCRQPHRDPALSPPEPCIQLHGDPALPSSRQAPAPSPLTGPHIQSCGELVPPSSELVPVHSTPRVHRQLCSDLVPPSSRLALDQALSGHVDSHTGTQLQLPMVWHQPCAPGSHTQLSRDLALPNSGPAKASNSPGQPSQPCRKLTPPFSGLSHPTKHGFTDNLARASSAYQCAHSSQVTTTEGLMQLT